MLKMTDKEIRLKIIRILMVGRPEQCIERLLKEAMLVSLFVEQGIDLIKVSPK